MLTKTTAEQGTTIYAYNADDTINTVTDARGAVSRFRYNGRHLVTAIEYPTEGVNSAWTGWSTFSYDAAGNRKRMTDGHGSTDYVYDQLSRLTSETRWFAGLDGSQDLPSGEVTLRYEHNLAGELTKITNPWDVQVSYNPDKIGRITSVTGANYAGVSTYISNVSYRAFGAPKGISYGNGKTLSLSYNNRLLLSQWNIPGVLGYGYSYNYFGENTGRVTFASNLTNGAGGRDASLDRSYSYDHVGRLNAAYSGTATLAHTGQEGGAWGGDGPYAQIYSHDFWGNITQRQGWGGTNAAYTATFNGNRMATNPGTGQPFAYDGAGNVTSEGTQTFTYDARGQQVTASSNGLQQGYGGDALRITKTENGVTTYYLRSSVLGGQVVCEINASGGWSRGYVYLGGQLIAIQSGGVNWVHQEPITKGQRITDINGSVTTTVELDPFGGETDRSENSAFQRHKYTSYERDANQSDDAMNRRYNRWWSRFDQPDPYDGSYDFGNPQSFNRYAYVNNDPVNFVDPTGLNIAGPDTRYSDVIGLSLAFGADLGADIAGEFGVSGYQFGDSSLVINTYLVGVERSYFLGSSQVDVRGIVSEPQNPTTPEDFRRETFNKFQADINRCIGEIFGEKAKKIPNQTLDNAPKVDVSVNGRDLANRSTAAGKFRSIFALPDPNKGKNGTVFIQSGAWNYPNYPLDVLQGAYIHEYGNILAYKYGGDFNKFGDKAGIGKYPWSKDFDTGANFQRCVFPSSVKW